MIPAEVGSFQMLFHLKKYINLIELYIKCGCDKAPVITQYYNLMVILLTETEIFLFKPHHIILIISTEIIML